MRRYLSKHWQGRYSLAISFWGNLLAVAALAYALAPIVTSWFPASARVQWSVATAYFVFCSAIVYPWSAIGVLRACERAHRDYRQLVWIRCAQACVVLGIVVIFVGAIGVVRSGLAAFNPPPPPPVVPKRYALEVLEDGTAVRLRGDIAHGVTRELRALLERHRDVRRIVLESEGGVVAEGRGLAVLIRERALDTYSFEACSSACTLAFVSGRERRLGPSAKLGFHRYRLDSAKTYPVVNPDDEFNADLAAYFAGEIDAAFLARIARTPAERMWYPSHAELERAGAIHGIAAEGPPPR